jgi:hypothetical protein
MNDDLIDKASEPAEILSSLACADIDSFPFLIVAISLGLTTIFLFRINKFNAGFDGTPSSLHRRGPAAALALLNRTSEKQEAR